MCDINGEKKREIEMCMWVLRVKLKGEGYAYICIEKKAGQYLIVLHINIYIVFTYSY